MLKTIITVVFVFFVFSTQAQSLFTPNKNYSFNQSKLAKKTTAKTTTDIQKKLDQLNVYKLAFKLESNTQQIIIKLNNKETLTFTKNANNFKTESNVILWEGITKNKSESNVKLSLKMKNQVIGGYIKYSSNKAYQIIAIGDDNYIIEPIKYKEDSCGTDLFMIPDFRTDKEKRVAKRLASKATSTAERGVTYNCGDENATVILRVLIAYTPEFANTFGTVTNSANSSTRQKKINAYLRTIIESVNEGYENSNIPLRVRLAFSYMTRHSEVGDKDIDYDQRFEVDGDGYFDEVFDYRKEHTADISALLVAANVGGRASIGGNMLICGKAGAASYFTFAHEIGHCFGLVHNLESFDQFDPNWLEETASWLLDFFGGYSQQQHIADLKRAGVFGYLGNNNRTIMSYSGSNGQLRRNRYSSPNASFNDGEIAGVSYTRAADLYQEHYYNGVQNDQLNGVLNFKAIYPDETVNIFAHRDWSISNYTVLPNAEVKITTTNKDGYKGITLKPGTHFTKGSDVTLSLIGCQEAFGRTSETAVTIESIENPLFEVKINKDFVVFPNPAKDFFTIKKQFETEQSNIKVQIFDSFGRMIYTVDNKNSDALNTTIDTYNYANGLYLIRIQGDNYKETKKVIIKN